ncbi:hypothetical protein D3C86_531230 [compost metagenome]|jgi:hypothetical protein
MNTVIRRNERTGRSFLTIVTRRGACKSQHNPAYRVLITRRLLCLTSSMTT